MKSASIFCLCILALALAVVGCGDDGPAPQGSLPPKVGSTWTHDRWYLDSNRQAQDPGTLVATVRETGTSFGTESDLLRIEEATDNDPDPISVYLRYEPNGDLRLLHPYFYPFFLTLPTGSKTDSIPLPGYDTTYVDAGTEYELRLSGTIRYAGAEELEAGGERLMTERIRISGESFTRVGANSSEQKVEIELWYAPSIGYFAKSEMWVEEGAFLGFLLDHGDRRVLKSWQLK